MSKKFGCVFIHGFNKNSTTWNITEYGKHIDIESIIKTKAETILVDIVDFKISPKIQMIPIIEQIMSSSIKKWIIVCHSLGVIHALELLRYSLPIIGVCLIDPTALDQEYINTLEERGWSDILDYCNNLQINIKPGIQYYIHIDYDTHDINGFNAKVEFYKKFAGPNDKSKLIIHPGKGHMIYYTDAPKIINSIISMMR